MIYRRLIIIVFITITFGLVQPTLTGMEKSGSKVVVSLFNCQLSPTESAQKISDQHVSLMRLAAQEKCKSLLQLINDSFDGEVNQIKMAGMATLAVPVLSDIEDTNWTINDFVIKLSFDHEPKATPSGKILMHDTRQNLNHITDFQLDQDAILLAFIRIQDKLILVAAQDKEDISNSQDVPAPPDNTVKAITGYSTSYKSEKFTLYSEVINWDSEVLSADEVVFNHAKAMIPTEKGDVILKGEKIYYSKKEKVLIGLKAILTSPNKKTYGNNSRIIVPIDKALDFKITQ